jgi:hypothetical protein
MQFGMIRLSSLLLLPILVFTSVIVFAQATTYNPDKVYGYDPLLYNGRIYAFFPPAGTGGTQYLYDKFDTTGSITLRGITYSNLALNYDIYNQQLILKYKNALGTSDLIQISAAWLEKFEVGGRQFKFETITDTTRRIYQVIGIGASKVLYNYKKELLLDTRLGSIDHYFPDAIREMYVTTDGRMAKFKNNRSFVTAFSQPMQSPIKKYLRKNKIKVKKVKDNVMTELINFCNTLNGS